MKTPYDLTSVAETYRAAHIRSNFASTHLSFVAQNINVQLERGGTVRVLDVGCGAGGGYKLLNDRLIGGRGRLDYVGIDESATQIDLAIADHRDNGSARFLSGSAEALPFPDNSFDTVFECRLFQFVTAPLKILAEMVRTARDVAIATLYTHEHNLPGFHPFYSYFEMDENRRIISGAEQLREVNMSRLVGALLMRDGSSNRYGYPFAKQRRTLPAHGELDEFLARFPGRVRQHDVVDLRLDTILAANGGDTGPTQEGDRLDYLPVRRHTLVLTN